MGSPVAVLRLVFGATRRDFGINLARVLVIASCVTLVLVAQGIVPTLAWEQRVELGRFPIGAGDASSQSTGGVFVHTYSSRYRDREIRVTDIASTGTAPTESGIRQVPLGLDRLPAPGEVIVSPGLMALIDEAVDSDQDRRLLLDRFDGFTITEGVGPAGLNFADQLVMFRGVPANADDGRLERVDGFVSELPPAGMGWEELSNEYVSGETFAFVASLVGTFVAFGLLVLKTLETGAVRRSVRDGELHLSGYSRMAIGTFFAAECMALVLFGVMAALGSVMLLRAVAVSVPIAGVDVWTATIVPSAARLVGLMALLGLWVFVLRVAIGFFGRVSSRRGPRQDARLQARRARAQGAVGLAGLAVLVAAVAVRPMWFRSGQGFVLLVALAVSATALAMRVLPILVGRVARPTGTTPGMLFAAMVDPSTSSRLARVALPGVVVGVVLVPLALLGHAVAAGDLTEAEQLARNDMLAEEYLGESPIDVSLVTGLGDTDVLQVAALWLDDPDHDGVTETSILTAPCAELARFLSETPNCATTAWVISGPDGPPAETTRPVGPVAVTTKDGFDDDTVPPRFVDLPMSTIESNETLNRLLAHWNSSGEITVLYPTEALTLDDDLARFHFLFVRVDSPDELEVVRTQITKVFGASSMLPLGSLPGYLWAGHELPRHLPRLLAVLGSVFAVWSMAISCANWYGDKRTEADTEARVVGLEDEYLRATRRALAGTVAVSLLLSIAPVVIIATELRQIFSDGDFSPVVLLVTGAALGAAALLSALGARVPKVAAA